MYESTVVPDAISRPTQSINVNYDSHMYIVYGLTINGKSYGSKMGKKTANIELKRNEEIKRVKYNKRGESR